MQEKTFRVRPDKKVELRNWPTRIDPLYESKKHAKQLLAAQVKELSGLQTKLYADNRYALLLIFQAMDAAGKDSAIKHVMSGVNPQGCQVSSFKHPSTEELEHDFLWRTTRNLPERGRIGIFNRSYYEEVLIVRVHPELLDAEGLDIKDRDKFWKQRYRSITEMERHLSCNNTKILKFFLHVSKEEQRRRFLARIEEADKNWKFSLGDIRERGYWRDYMQAYEACLAHTSTAAAPWYVVPADDKNNTSLIIADIIVESLRDLKLAYPKLTGSRQRELQEAKKLLQKESKTDSE